MSITSTIKETDNYAYHFDKMMGVGWFERKKDQMVTLLDTGSDAIHRTVCYTTMKDEDFNLIAEEQTFVVAEQEME